MKTAARYSTRPSAFTSRTTTLFATNVNNSAPIGVSLVIDPNFQTLITELLVYLNFYAVGDFKSIKINLTNSKYIAMSGALGRLLISDPTVSLLRTSCMASLQGLQRAYVQYTQLTDTTTSYKVTKERAAILDDMDLLRAFLLELNTRSNTSIFGDHVIASSVPAVIPPTYLLYIQKYGFPQDGVFDVNLLAGLG
jgi:hypothetical protein